MGRENYLWCEMHELMFIHCTVQMPQPNEWLENKFSTPPFIQHILSDKKESCLGPCQLGASPLAVCFFSSGSSTGPFNLACYEVFRVWAAGQREFEGVGFACTTVLPRLDLWVHLPPESFRIPVEKLQDVVETQAIQKTHES